MTGLTKGLPRMPGFYLVKGPNFELAAELRRFDDGHLRWFTTEGTDVGHDQFRSDAEYKRVRFDDTPPTEEQINNG
ncbi:hypothetical protein N9913_02815 [Porticoccaceae bacterium]|nr:hypothetical protein [Porticoccaceae bacterium]